MSAFLSALSFLSILRVPGSRSFDARMVMHFPLVGLLLGGALVGVDGAAALLFPPLLRAMFDVLFLAMVTGALHLDGLADSADGLFSHRPKNEMLAIMKDSCIGVMGAATLGFCLLLKVGALHGLDGGPAWLWLLFAPALARSAQVVALVVMSDARGGESMGSSLYQHKKFHGCLGCAVPLTLPFVFDVRAGLWMLAAFGVTTALLLIYFHRRLGGMTGDTLGALSETVETAVLIVGAAFHHVTSSIENISL
ncbi:adenosylcobinamide-GDP ribazoletransferase [Nitrospina watsonii]|uniref:Adenosylcobinamide-GDP ribazoletransferase n=1 Tax=Nitrospina watsonii TaxID=1323948 RepID=A0ABN8W6R6_9BACT|nr:adenosylcobinamide-GDP ribazoletransferase [Nitrospina watsonii]CAI2719336.1 Adenosylcobinamide-GDP ribazoletransferase [Nitrospina watsonii]